MHLYYRIPYSLLVYLISHIYIYIDLIRVYLLLLFCKRMRVVNNEFINKIVE